MTNSFHWCLYCQTYYRESEFDQHRHSDMETHECPVCEGRGTDYYNETCMTCGGKGIVDEDGQYVEDEEE